MKCIILAGGFGDRLWPLSRKNFPKQFLNLDGGNSLFQETITRNMPYCDGFYIVTNTAFHEIVEGQMKQFQGISYEIVLEKEAKGTAPAISMVSHMLSKEEELLITPADLYIQGDGYADAIYKAKELSEEGRGVLFGTRAEEPSTIYGYIRYEGNRVVRFIEKPSKALANRIFSDDDIYWNSGMILCRNAFLKREFKEHAPYLKRQTERIHIEKAILASDIGINPSNDGRIIRLVFPELTEERRKDLVKDIKKKAEHAKVAVRNIRRDANDAIKKAAKANEISEDEQKQIEDEIQKMTDKYIVDIDKCTDAKTSEILTV